MHRRLFLIGAAALAACSPPAPQGGAPSKPGTSASPATTAAADDPAAIIRPIYAPYLQNNTNVSLPDLKDAAPWSASLREAIVAMETRSDDENSEGLDFDPIVNAQDWQLSNFNVAAERVVAQSHAVVRASFLNSGAQQEVMYDLIWENGGWRIDNMRSGGMPDGWDLRQLLSGGSGGK